VGGTDPVMQRTRTATANYGLIGGIAAIPFIVHLLTNTRYGYFRDEFYYIACSQHLDWGYVDHPPLSIALLVLERWLLGDSPPAIRFLPAVAGAALIFLTAMTARELGGGRFAQALAGLAVACAPIYLGLANFFSMNAFEPLFWTAAACILIRIVNTENSKLWLLFGGVAGLGLQNKHSMLFFGFAVAAALLLTRERKRLADKWLWLGAGTAALIFLPNVVWEITHNWPTVEFMRNAQAYKIARLSPIEFLMQQMLMLNPLALPIWLAGLCYFFSREGRRYQFCGWMYIVLLAVFMVENAKAYYLTPIYPLLLAAGATAIESIARRAHWRWLRVAAPVALVIGGIAAAPLALPVLPVEALIRYGHLLGVAGSVKRTTSETAALGELPQYFADMFGWDEVVSAVARAYESLSAEDRQKAAIFVGNYGEAGAINFLGKSHGLPEAISGHNNYWLWGPGDYSGEVVIVLGYTLEDLKPMFDSVEQAGTVHCKYCMPFENDRPVYICRGLKRPLREIWPRLKRYV
jgi:hypothetical protein